MTDKFEGSIVQFIKTKISTLCVEDPDYDEERNISMAHQLRILQDKRLSIGFFSKVDGRRHEFSITFKDGMYRVSHFYGSFAFGDKCSGATYWPFSEEVVVG